MLTAALFTIALSWKELKCIINRRMDKLWYIHTMEHYIVIKKQSVLICEIIWINLKDILSERQTQNSAHQVRVEAKLI